MVIHNDWIERAIREAMRQHVQADGRFTGLIQVPEMEGRVTWAWFYCPTERQSIYRSAEKPLSAGR